MLSKGGDISGVLCQSLSVYGRNAGNEVCNCIDWKCVCVKFVILNGRTLLNIYIYIFIYRVSKEERTKLRESVPYVELYRYNPKHLYPKLNSYGDNGHRKVWASVVSTYCTPSVTPYSSTAHARQRDTAS